MADAALLVGTHLYAFLLIPAAMYVFYSKIDELHEKRARSPFVALLGMSFMMVRVGLFCCFLIFRPARFPATAARGASSRHRKTLTWESKAPSI